MLRTVPGTHSARIMRKPSLIITFIHSLLRSSWCSFEKISQLYFATGGLSCISANCVHRSAGWEGKSPASCLVVRCCQDSGGQMAVFTAPNSRSSLEVCFAASNSLPLKLPPRTSCAFPSQTQVAWASSCQLNYIPLLRGGKERMKC